MPQPLWRQVNCKYLFFAVVLLYGSDEYSAWSVLLIRPHASGVEKNKWPDPTLVDERFLSMMTF